VPTHAVGAAPAAHGQIAGVGVGVAGFFVRVQGFKRVLRVQLSKHMGQLTYAQVQLAAAGFQRAVQVAQAFMDESQVLRRSVGLRPQAGLQHVQAQHRSVRGGLCQRGVVVQAQVALEPHHAVAAKGGRAIEWLEHVWQLTQSRWPVQALG